MRVGVISDVHGNLVALEAVLADMPAVDALVNAGDVVGYNPWPGACVDAMRGDRSVLSSPLARERLPTEPVSTVKGNHDRAVATDTTFRFNDMALAGVEYAREELTEDQIDWLRGLPDRRLCFDDRVRIVHGHPDDPDHYTYPREFEPELLDGEDVLVMGHTHVQDHEVFEEGVVMNPGSVGQPRDRDPDAAYAVVDLDDRTVREYRVSYDIERVVAAVEDAGLPKQIGTRLRKGR